MRAPGPDCGDTDPVAADCGANGVVTDRGGVDCGASAWFEGMDGYVSLEQLFVAAAHAGRRAVFER
jgi:hypothetical protein